MKLVNASKGKMTIEITDDDRRVISGLFAMISALQNPGWEDSTGQADTAMTPEQFDAAYDAWTSLTDGPRGRAYFVGK